MREFNPRYAEAEGALLGKFRHLHTDIYGNREFVEHLRNRGKYFDHEESRERDLILIDYDEDFFGRVPRSSLVVVKPSYSLACQESWFNHSRAVSVIAETAG